MEVAGDMVEVDMVAEADTEVAGDMVEVGTMEAEVDIMMVDTTMSITGITTMVTTGTTITIVMITTTMEAHHGTIMDTITHIITSTTTINLQSLKKLLRCK